ncbi:MULTISPECIES: hypothetical protein [Micrococcales]|uniref:Uncharacterized protein n=3 Tax=Brevibacterium TaxID=1696 RepID=A0A2H1KC44_BRELN|nr:MULTISPECIES: hypothetical protein [Brevibacterium]KAB1943093.1 hypothetical protein F8227_16030 [Brevibacterium linens ATCC 9172]TGD11621.1 hypothetical protein EB836_07060 [Brevibacterium sp. S111]SMX92522.1 hypothetical protein BANT10_02510 [Brevibacterium antiquum]SMX97266.1 hypothetical protein BLIN101_03202 [Brevibacterium linens]SMY01432.1 hypothetical protein BLIN9172_03388 [Brevibacterium linens ATCC 9172]
MVFRGEVRSVGELLAASLVEPGPVLATDVGVRHTAAGNAKACRNLLAEGEGLDACWRFGVLQTLDDYTSTLRRGGPGLAAGVFVDEPELTGAGEADAAFAALADHLAERDGWSPPVWALDPARRTTAWYPSVPAIFRADADRESPRAFRQRGIFLTARSLFRA